MRNTSSQVEKPKRGKRTEPKTTTGSKKRSARERAKAVKGGSGEISGPRRESRIDVRTTPEQKKIIEYAAALSGESKTTFVLRSVLESASRRIQEQNRTVTTIEGWRRFWRLVSDEAAPNAALKRAAKLHDKLVITENGTRR